MRIVIGEQGPCKVRFLLTRSALLCRYDQDMMAGRKIVSDQGLWLFWLTSVYLAILMPATVEAG